jgi:hypothetical protein
MEELEIRRSTYLLAWARPQKCRVRRIIFSSHSGRITNFPFSRTKLTSGSQTIFAYRILRTCRLDH